jgi:hypothetical protein
MRLSPFHVQLAAEFAKGKRNKEILQDYPITDSRLSVIKANPLFKKEIEAQRQKLQDQYSKAIEVLEDAATDVAKELVTLVKNPAISAETRSRTAENILNRIALKGGKLTPQSGNELVFEQLLRVTKRISHDSTDDAPLTFDPEEAYKELMSELQPVEDEPEQEPINVTPDPLSFTRQLPTDEPIPATGDNGTYKKFTLSPRLREALNSSNTH